jgi:hypothetical protein
MNEHTLHDQMSSGILCVPSDGVEDGDRGWHHRKWKRENCALFWVTKHNNPNLQPLQKPTWTRPKPTGSKPSEEQGHNNNPTL